LSLGILQSLRSKIACGTSANDCDTKFSHAETRGFEPPIPFRENLISSEAH
jgi:hypothetical protein